MLYVKRWFLKGNFSDILGSKILLGTITIEIRSVAYPIRKNATKRLYNIG